MWGSSFWVKRINNLRVNSAVRFGGKSIISVVLGRTRAREFWKKRSGVWKRGCPNWRAVGFRRY